MLDRARVVEPVGVRCEDKLRGKRFIGLTFVHVTVIYSLSFMLLQ